MLHHAHTFPLANRRRLILYFPVSALVTLFGNILQNPNDPRARADIRLMNLVVGFLSMLGSEEEHGGVKRMLGICAEFERIAKVVVDKAEKDSNSRKKRKGHEDSSVPKVNISSNRPPIPSTPATDKPMPVFQGSPSVNGGMPGQITDHTVFSPMSGASPNNPWMGSAEAHHVDYNDPNYVSPAGMTPFADIQQYTQSNHNGMSTNGMSGMSPLNMNTFQQPFVPQDLWQMPMTLEWDWADMTSGVYSGFDTSLAENGMLPNAGLSQSGVMPDMVPPPPR